MATTTKTPTAKKPAAQPKAAKAKSGERQCSAGPRGSYGITLKERCPNATHRETAALCAEHESLWREENKRRRAERVAAEEALAGAAPKAKPAAKANPTEGEGLAAQLEESIAERNAALLKQKRAASRKATAAA
jgi:hypothetical protein